MTLTEMLAKIEEHLKAHGGAFAVGYTEKLNRDDKWTASMEWGKEAADSDMVGAAAYGIGENLTEAVQAMLGDAGLVK